NYQYIKGDPAFRAFSYAMKKRFDSGRAVANESVYIKSMQSSSAIQELFSRCPEYMGGFVERAVFAIDTLVASGAIAETSYVDALLSGWYDNRSREERTVAKRARSKAGTDRVVTEFSNIRAAYRHEDGRVSLVIPSIRLGEQADNPPWITVYRYPGDDTPYADKLRYYGDYFCITSRREAIPLEALLPEQGERMEPRVVISHGGRDIYDSGTRLFRDFIAFDDGGAETTKRPDREYVNLFIAKGGTVRGEDSSPDYTASVCGGGHLYRVLIDDATFLSVNGTNVFPVEKMVSGLTLNMSVAPVSHCRYFDGQRECAVFTAPTTLTVTSERESVEKQYRVVVDESPLSLSDCGRAEGGFRVPLPHERGVHELRIVENASNRRIYTLYYVVIEGFSLDFSGFYFYDNFPENGCLEVADSTGRARYPYKLSPGQDAMHVPYREGELSVSIPALSCRLDGKPLSPGGQTIWHDDIAMSALLEVDVPRGYTCVTVVGQRMFPSARVEFGNEIRAGHAADVEAVGLLIRKNDEPPLQIKLFDVAFEARFASAPLLAERDGLLWCVEGNYIGGQESEFEVSLGRKGLEIGRYHVGLVDELIPLDRPLEDGVYDYTVFLKSSGFFSKAEELVHGHFFVGDPALVRFDDCAVIVTEAILESDRVPLKPASGILTKLRYIGERGLNGETQPYPCYEGCLQYRHNGDLRPYATREFEYGGIFR
ncbi:hypothetical protein LJC34_08085, partial [Oscillospiraceae bacterium OttesenSCG-928-G22]|nr:hypothetical protein [Oscillospiraceae bacterium OttesenSCG-928-G22]